MSGERNQRETHRSSLSSPLESLQRRLGTGFAVVATLRAVWADLSRKDDMVVVGVIEIARCGPNLSPNEVTVLKSYFLLPVEGRGYCIVGVHTGKHRQKLQERGGKRCVAWERDVVNGVQDRGRKRWRHDGNKVMGVQALGGGGGGKADAQEGGGEEVGKSGWKAAVTRKDTYGGDAMRGHGTALGGFMRREQGGWGSHIEECGIRRGRSSHSARGCGGY
ncbi:hypothetical protein B0H14DRAFT_2608986 [Mycena olivaceomarginata]|nr:hypothetical protein B0H14DRAFT_2608986 [Mycena olivaceomarginata]